MQAWTSTVQGGPAPGEGAMKEPGGRSRGRCRHGQVQGGLVAKEGAMEEPGTGVGAGAGRTSTGLKVFISVTETIQVLLSRRNKL